MTEKPPLATEAAFHEKLQELVRRAHDNDVDVEGGWACRNGDGHPDWDVVVTEVEKAERSE